MMKNKQDLYKHISLLKESGASKEMLLGVTVSLFFNKEIFIKNTDLSDFIVSSFSLVLPPYIVRSRTLMIAKICRVIFFSDEKNLNIYKKNIITDLNLILYPEDSIKQKKTSSNKRSNMDSWVSEIIKRKV